MTDLRTYASECFAEKLCTYAFKVDFNDEGSAIVDDGDNGHDPGEPADARIHRLTQERVHMHPELDYRTAMRQVLDNSPDLVRAYAAQGSQPSRPAPTVVKRNHPMDPSMIVHEKALRLQQDESCGSYSLAVHKVLDSDPTLARKYAVYCDGVR